MKDENNQVVNWLKIVALKFVKNETAKIFYKYNFDDEYTGKIIHSFIWKCSRWLLSGINIRGARRPNRLSFDILKPAYTQRIPISQEKRLDLMNLCKPTKERASLIPECFHQFYASLPSAASKRNVAPEPGVGSDFDDDD